MGLKQLIIIVFVLIFLKAQPSTHWNPYQVLGLQRGASRFDVRKAFKDLSLKYHPDHNPEHRQLYETIIKAYEELKRIPEEGETQNEEGGYFNIDDLLIEIEWSMRKNARVNPKQPPTFIDWCWKNPKIVLAALSISLGLVVICK